MSAAAAEIAAKSTGQNKRGMGAALDRGIVLQLFKKWARSEDRDKVNARCTVHGLKHDYFIFVSATKCFLISATYSVVLTHIKSPNQIWLKVNSEQRGLWCTAVQGNIVFALWCALSEKREVQVSDIDMKGMALLNCALFGR